MVIFAIENIIPGMWPYKIAQFVQSVALDHTRGIWLVRSWCFPFTIGPTYHLAVMIDGFVYDIGVHGAGTSDSGISRSSADATWEVSSDATYGDSGYVGWVRLYDNPEVNKSRDELKEFADSLNGEVYHLLLNNCHDFCYRMISFATGEPLSLSSARAAKTFGYPSSYQGTSWYDKILQA
mmetsp:Transcript_27402/g.64432  ORF Transcript_27402/g.64432 Transcript_27402/m.64432 type:complete len:180 (+) Transcript_27402:82-621(+)|eukprot:s1724_g4.t1